MYLNRAGYSQADERSYRIFSDQHGREWGADIENSTQAPCGPMSQRFKSPLRIPSKYIVFINVQAGKIHIDYDRWIQDLTLAHEDYLEHKRAHKNRMNPAQPHLIADDDPNLLYAVGEPPEAIQQVQAAKQGNRWVLGLTHPKTGDAMPKPGWAVKYFPEKVEITIEQFPDDFDFDDEPEREVMGDEPSETSHAELSGVGSITTSDLVGVDPAIDQSWDKTPEFPSVTADSVTPAENEQ